MPSAKSHAATETTAARSAPSKDQNQRASRDGLRAANRIAAPIAAPFVPPVGAISCISGTGGAAAGFAACFASNSIKTGPRRGVPSVIPSAFPMPSKYQVSPRHCPRHDCATPRETHGADKTAVRRCCARPHIAQASRSGPAHGPQEQRRPPVRASLGWYRAHEYAPRRAPKRPAPVPRCARAAPCLAR